jgi:hypothetical protein
MIYFHWQFAGWRRHWSIHGWWDWVGDDCLDQWDIKESYYKTDNWKVFPAGFHKIFAPKSLVLYQSCIKSL